MKNLMVLALIVAVAAAAPSGKSAGTYSSAPIQGISYVQPPSVATFAQPMQQVAAAAAAYPSGYAVHVDDDDDDDNDDHNIGGFVLTAYGKQSSDSGEDNDNDNDDGSNEGGNQKSKGKDQGSGEDDDDNRGKKGQKKGSGHDDDNDNDDDDKLKLSAGTVLGLAPLWTPTVGVVSTGPHGAPTTLPAGTPVVHHTSPILSTQTGTIGVPSVSAQTTWTTGGQNIAWPSAPATPSVSTQTTHGAGTLGVRPLGVPSAQTVWTASNTQNLAWPAAIAPLPAAPAAIVALPAAPSTQILHQPAQTWHETQHTSISLPSTAHLQPALNRDQTTVHGGHPTVKTHAALLQPISVSSGVKQETVPSTQIIGTHSGLPVASIQTSPHGVVGLTNSEARLTGHLAQPGSILTTYSQQGSSGSKSHPAAGTALRLTPALASLTAGSTGPHQKSGYTGRINRNY